MHSHIHILNGCIDVHGGYELTNTFCSHNYSGISGHCHVSAAVGGGSFWGFWSDFLFGVGFVWGFPQQLPYWVFCSSLFLLFFCCCPEEDYNNLDNAKLTSEL